jgi:hypothetical protein
LKFVVAFERQQQSLRYNVMPAASNKTTILIQQILEFRIDSNTEGLLRQPLDQNVD